MRALSDKSDKSDWSGSSNLLTKMQTMTCWKTIPILIACALAAGCAKTTRSISHSGYQPEATYVGSDPGLQYRGELSEFDVLGILRGEIASEAEIRRALERWVRGAVKMCRVGNPKADDTGPVN